MADSKQKLKFDTKYEESPKQIKNREARNKTRMPVEMLTAFEHNVQALYNYVTDAEGCAGEVAYIIVHLAAKHRMAIKVSDTSVGAQAEGSPGIFVELADHPGETLDMMLQLAVLLAAANEHYSETGV